MKNRYEIRDELTTIFLNSPKYGMKEAIIDTVDLSRVKEFPNAWGVHWDPTICDFYCRGKIHLPNSKSITIYLHRWITECPTDLQVDHFDNDPLNNRRNNLRILTNSENQQNLKSAQRNSRSGVLGVHWNKNDGVWRAKIEVNGKQRHIGSFAHIREAEDAVKKARAELMPYSKEASLVSEKHTCPGRRGVR